MKQVFIVSGLVAALMTLMVAVGLIDFNQYVPQALTNGNAFYQNKEYEKAKEVYEGAIEKETNSTELQYNLGLVAYAMKDYEQAIEHYSQSEDSNMALGNAYYRQGSNLQDPKQQMQIYQQGLEQYLTGMKVQPDNIELKYNYEFLKKQMDDQQKNQDQDNQNKDQENEDQKNQDKDQENKDQENQNQDEQNQDERNEEQEGQDEQNQNGQNEDQQNQENQENQDDENQSKEDQDKENQDQQNEAQDGENQEQEDQQNQDQSKYSENGELSDQEKEAIEQVLRMLEQQEKQSLKNNQAVMNQGKEEANDW